MALMLELATRAGRYGDAVKLGEWEECIFPFSISTMELGGKKLGIVATATLAKPSRKWRGGLGSVLIAAVPATSPRAAAESVGATPFPSRHCLAPLSAYTGNRNLINEQSLA